MKEFIRISICLAGLTLMGFLVADLLRGWHLIGMDVKPIWVIIPILSVYLLKELTYSPYIKSNPNLPTSIFQTLDKLFENLLLILSIIVLISAPFVWFGAIEALIQSAR